MPDDQEERIKALEAEIAALRKPAPKLEPLYRTLVGQGSVQFDRAGNRITQPPTPENTTVGGSSAFGNVYREGPNGTKVYAPDGVVRDIRTGEAVAVMGPGSTGTGPVRSAQHQQAIDQLDRAFPVTRPIPTKE